MRKLKSDLVNAIGALHQLAERFPFLEVEFIPDTKYHQLFVEK
ncbi:hypothetical protein [Sulfobacillus thermosulfidooxidans]|nr:hypothetical protein [Sulfobacillus thermosulfidooxidans]